MDVMQGITSHILPAGKTRNLHCLQFETGRLIAVTTVASKLEANLGDNRDVMS